MQEQLTILMVRRKMMKNGVKVFMVMLIVLISATGFVFAEGVQETGEVQQTAETQQQAKYVIFLIGDGMAMPQVSSTEAFLGTAGDAPMEKLAFSEFPAQGMITTYAADRFITGSAAAGTALASGYKTYINAIGVGVDKQPLKTLVEYAEEKGMATGLVTSTRLTHATPAVFAAHNVDRGNENEIAADMADSGVDYMVGGGYRYFVKADGPLKSKRTDDRDIVAEMVDMGYKTFISEEATQDFLAYEPWRGDQVIGLFGYSHLDYDIDNSNQPSLAELTAKGIDLLSQDEDGFFMMVEGGRIDHACHANDAVTAIQDTLAFNDAVKEAIDFYNEHPEETLIVVTADHETGGLTLGFAGTEYESAFDTLQDQHISYEAFDSQVLSAYKDSHNRYNYDLNDLLPAVEDFFGLADLTDTERAQLEEGLQRSMGGEVERSASQNEYLLYGTYEPFTVTITHLLNQRAGLAWTSYSHTAVPVPTFAMGPSAETFQGYYDNTDVFWKIASIMDIPVVRE
jgi:alkaline phosphatase